MWAMRMTVLKIQVRVFADLAVWIRKNIAVTIVVALLVSSTAQQADSADSSSNQTHAARAVFVLPGINLQPGCAIPLSTFPVLQYLGA
ncbi:hypothetical protein DSL72_009333 [Monilinia vaccinii-corymbosi]|uniref:Uncharacterized protein n=1 Tax=Monilinia vaccinii-corymbosi TaxID=61207 RepID=A0A8A3PQT8_9HELO|nr:hypothetical protein DSL72_009333 [Monilinia vaccinii-corymbosi]